MQEICYSFEYKEIQIKYNHGKIILYFNLIFLQK